MSNPRLDPRPRIPRKTTQLPMPLSEAELKEKMTYYLREGPVKELARLFHNNTCPGDWDYHPTAQIGNMLQTFYEADVAEDKLSKTSEVTSIIRYRWETCLLADQIVDIFELPVPGNSTCILWELGNWWETTGRNVTDWLWYQSFRIVCDNRFELVPRRPDQGTEFRRPWLYAMAALFEWNKSDIETLYKVHQIMDFMKVVGRFNKQSVGRVLPVRRNDCVPR
jgi:hypothetical protein